MRPWTKPTLIASAVILLPVIAFIAISPGKLPTQPTPAGVPEIPGLRYVGGDEFDGTALDTSRWITWSPSTQFAISKGTLTLTTPEKGPENDTTLHLKTKLNGERRIRIETRYRMKNPEQLARRITKLQKVGMQGIP